MLKRFTDTFNRLLEGLHKHYDKDADILQAFEISYVGAGTFAKYTIFDNEMRIITDVPSDNFRIDLDSLSILDLSNVINSHASYTATAPSSTHEDLTASSLIERNEHDINHPKEKRLMLHQSLTWDILKAFSSELSRSNLSIDEGLNQMNFQISEGVWADYWGQTIFGIARIPGESDFDYTRRVLSTILLIKVNNRAIENLLKELTTFFEATTDIRIIDDPVFITSRGSRRNFMLRDTEDCNSYPDQFGDLPVRRMLGDLNDDSNRSHTVLFATFSLYIIMTPSQSLDMPAIKEALKTFKAAGVNFNVIRKTTVDEAYPGASEFTTEVDVLDEGQFWVPQWIITNNFSKITNDFASSKTLYSRATEKITFN